MQAARLPTSWPYVVVIMSGGFCVALGLMALVGWHTHNLTLIRALPASAPTYYNTALGFLLCGAGNEGSGPQQCCICVEDNGIGFEEQYLEQIFQPFQRLCERGEYEGTGMGLAICRAIVERHGGDITARSTPGQGTTFIVTLPAQQSNKEAAQWPNEEDRLSS